MTVTTDISADTQAALLLTAPLLPKHRDASPDPLQPSHYRRLTRFLDEIGWHLADLLTEDAEDLLFHDRLPLDADRLRLLLARGFHLSQVMEQWQSRSIWVIGATDDVYPSRLRRLEKGAPPILYGCGDPAFIGSRGVGCCRFPQRGRRHPQLCQAYRRTHGSL